MKAKVDVALIEHGELRGLPCAVLDLDPEEGNLSADVVLGSIRRIAEVVCSANRRVLIKNVPETEPKKMIETLKVVLQLVRDGFFVVFEHEGSSRPMVAQFGGYCILHTTAPTDSLVDEVHYWVDDLMWEEMTELPGFPGAKRRYVHTPDKKTSYTREIAELISNTEEDWFFPDAV